MEKVSRRHSKILCTKKDSKPSKKDQKGRSKSENDDFFTELKKKKRVHNSRGVQKITTSRLTVRTKTFNNAVRSVFAVKEKYFNYEEDTKALLDQDLFKIIDLSNPVERPVETSAIFQNDSQNKSIFREINAKFEELTPTLTAKNDPYLISDDNLRQLVSKKVLEHKNLILNPWAKILQDFLHYLRARDFQEVILTEIVRNQSGINEACALFELKTKFRGVPLAGTCLRRKFVRRCNDLTNLQNLGGQLLLSSQASDIINQISFTSIPQLKMAATPEKQPKNNENLIVISYKTPESQKFSIGDLVTTCSKFRAAVKSKTSKKYIELDRQKCTDQVFVTEYGLSDEQQKHFLEEAVRIEQFKSLDLNSIFERPNKLQTVRKRPERFSIEESSPKSVLQGASPPPLHPNRRLNFIQNSTDKSDEQNIDFCLLEDVGKLRISPLKFGGLFTENGARKSDRITPKRGLEAMLSPGEVKLRQKVRKSDQENIYARVKRFAAEEDELGPIPTSRATPQFKYRPRVLH